jgi:hypothetical protein
MTQQDTSRNNLKISTFGDFSVPIVSQTEIDPMKTALSVMLRRHDDGPQPSRRPYRKPPGRAARARTAISHRVRSACRRRALRTPSPTRATAPARGDGFRAGATACETGDAINPNSLDGPPQCLSRKDNSRCNLRDLFYFWCGLLLAWRSCPRLSFSSPAAPRRRDAAKPF